MARASEPEQFDNLLIILFMTAELQNTNTNSEKLNANTKERAAKLYDIGVLLI